MPAARMLAVIAAALLAGVPARAEKPNPHAGLDCNYCHLDTPRVGVDTRDTVTFWRAERDEPKLCERCHEPQENFHPLYVVPGPDRLGTRRPTRLPLGAADPVKGQVVCTTCHALHASAADFALLRGFPGAPEDDQFSSWQNLCRECHADGLAQRSPHAGDERSCAFCHSAKPQPGQPVAVTPQGRRLCEFCHGRQAEGHYAGVNPFSEPKDCPGCHDPHAGRDRPARLRQGYFDPIRESVMLNPHRRRTLCFACHADSPAGKALRATNPVALCQRCHGSGRIAGMSHPLTKVPSGYQVPAGWPLAEGLMTCLTCHRPGHPEEDAGPPHLLRSGSSEDPAAVCWQCHARSQWEGTDPHEEAARERTGCELCHAGKPEFGKDTAATVSFVADINLLCYRCHSVGPHPGGVQHTLTVGDRPQIPAEMPLGKGRRVVCATCHNPHLDDTKSHLLRGVKESTAFCSRCHRF